MLRLPPQARKDREVDAQRSCSKSRCGGNRRGPDPNTLPISLLRRRPATSPTPPAREAEGPPVLLFLPELALRAAPRDVRARCGPPGKPLAGDGREPGTRSGRTEGRRCPAAVRRAARAQVRARLGISFQR